MTWTPSFGISRVAGAIVACVALAGSVFAITGAAARAAEPVCAMACCRDAVACCCRTGGGHDDEAGSMPELAPQSAVASCAEGCAAVSTGLGHTASVHEAVPGGVDGPCAAKPPPTGRAVIAFSDPFDRSAPRAPPVLPV